MHEIRTERASLRPVQGADAVALHELFTHPDVRRYLWDDEIVSLDTVRDVIARSEAQFREHGHGLWVARLHEHPSRIAGFCGFWHFHEPPQLELLYGLAAREWGRGLATELARAMLRHGFEVLGFTRIIGSTDAPNAASCRVMERAGMRLLRRQTSGGKDTVFYVAPA